MPIPDTGFMLRSLEFLASFFVIFVGLCFVAIVIVYIVDISLDPEIDADAGEAFRHVAGKPQETAQVNIAFEV